MTLETKHFAVEELKADDSTRTVTGFGSVFGNTDAHGDVVVPGAFGKSIGARRPAMLWQHRADLIPGVWEAVEERPRGLYLEGRFADTPLGQEAYTLAKMGALTGLSIGFSTKRYSIDAKRNVRSLEEVDLFEVSLVTFPANERATITHVKTRPETLRQFEELLRREGGFSQRDATTVALHGFKALATPGEPDEGHRLAALRDLLTQFTTQLKL